MRAPSPQVVQQNDEELHLGVNQGELAPLPWRERDKVASAAANNQFYRENPQLPQTGFANIATAISDIMSEIGVVGEGGENKFQNYKYMSYKDMYRKLTPLMGKHGLAVIPTEKSRSIFDNDNVVTATYSFTIIHKTGEVWPFQPEWTGVSRARDSKGGWDDKALNKCATAAQKYFLKALFQVPSGEDDEDPDHHDGSVSRETKVRAPSPSQAKPKEAPSPFKAKGDDANLWSADLERIIKEAKSADELNTIDKVNADALERLNLKFPDLYKKLYAIFVARGKALAKAKEDPISSGLSIRYSSDPAEYKKTIIDLMDSAKDYATLETIYNSNVAPIEEQMDPQDAEDLLGAFRRNENRLSP